MNDMNRRCTQVRLASLALAALLQVLPVARMAALHPAGVGSPLSCVLLWLAGAAVMIGGHHAVSGASASVSGMVKYSGTTPVGTPTNLAVEPVGRAFKYRITVSNPGSDVAQNYFNCFPLPPGLTLNTNFGGAGYIIGTPTQIGTYAVTLLAGNKNFPTPATARATIVIYPPNTAPAITNQPLSRSVLAGSNVSLSVGVVGSLPLRYQWQRNGTNLPGKVAADLVLARVSAALAGDYRVTVANAFGTVTSAVARVTLREPLQVDLRLGSPVWNNNAVRFPVTGPVRTNYVIWAGTTLTNWTPLRTNWVVDGYLLFTETNISGADRRFYRGSLSP